MDRGRARRVRSVNGASATWYRAATRRGAGRIRSGGITRDIRFLQPEKDIEDALDGAYRDKYGASSSATQSIIAPLARVTTIRLTLADPV